MAATKLQANWSGVSHGNTSITKVTGVNFDQGGELTEFAADGDLYPTTIINLMNRPRCQVASGDIATLMGIAPGTTANLSATHKDAKLAASGAIAYVLSNAVFESATANGPFGAIGSVSGNFRAFSGDGTTNPLAFTRT